jgi:hypothetical protein
MLPFNWKSGFLLLIFCLFLEAKPLMAQPVAKDTSTIPYKYFSKASIRPHKQPHGIFIYYDANGQIMRKEKWKDGKFFWLIKYDAHKRKLYGVNSRSDTSFFKACNCTN